MQNLIRDIVDGLILTIEEVFLDISEYVIGYDLDKIRFTNYLEDNKNENI